MGVRGKLGLGLNSFEMGLGRKLGLGLNEFQVEGMEKIIVRIRIELISNKD